MIQLRPQGVNVSSGGCTERMWPIFHIAKAARLIALVQISSASVERIFSQMKQIQDSCGDSMLEETFFGHVCERCNTYEVLQKRGR
jgi:hypothetical protein